ncbi:hypothetical protein EW026_g962 [Hermanssonia centrifuga]|uniref:Enoyl reductase (ER) domain-containing protein n=1 Tax=Hermanssonia centrifuga TaxID=98765 RepID=A0A4S4KXJ9_9APHY|nr:hypothetical protein EW026_g962 [Hermanssonia centrifuga]
MDISQLTALPADRRMIGYRYYPQATEPVREEAAIPTPNDDEVLIRVLAAGVCHSDIGLLDPNGLGRIATTNYFMGHENAGIIVALGSSVPSAFPELVVGLYVAVCSVNACFAASCPLCQTGADNLCRKNRFLGLGCDGAFAQYCAVRAAVIVPVPGGIQRIPPAVAAIATDAVLTPYHAMKTCVRIEPTHTVLVLGVGGLGLNAVAIAKHCLNAHCVLACDTRQSSLPQALEVGADHAVLSGKLLQFVEGAQLSIDVVFDFVGNQASFDTAVSVVKPCGKVHIVGLGAATLQVTPLVWMNKDLMVGSSFWGTKRELAEVLDAIAEGKIKPRVETRPLDQCVQVLDDLRNGKVKNRIALIP